MNRIQQLEKENKTMKDLIDTSSDLIPFALDLIDNLREKVKMLESENAELKSIIKSSNQPGEEVGKKEGRCGIIPLWR